MKYNPYGWKVEKRNNKEKPKMNMDVYPGPMVFECILDELSRVSNELEITRIEYEKLKEDFEKTERYLETLEKRKYTLIQKMYD